MGCRYVPKIALTWGTMNGDQLPELSPVLVKINSEWRVKIWTKYVDLVRSAVFLASVELSPLYRMVTFGVRTVNSGENTVSKLKEANDLLGQTMGELVVKKEMLSEAIMANESLARVNAEYR